MNFIDWIIITHTHCGGLSNILLELLLGHCQWENFGEIEGNEIEARMEKDADLIVILERSIGMSTYQGTNALNFLSM